MHALFVLYYAITCDECGVWISFNMGSSISHCSCYFRLICLLCICDATPQSQHLSSYITETIRVFLLMFNDCINSGCIVSPDYGLDLNTHPMTLLYEARDRCKSLPNLSQRLCSIVNEYGDIFCA
eukprot:212313_1